MTVRAPLRLSIDVACGAEQAFELWTSRIATWWPPDHTVSGKPALVVLEAGVGGRIFERAADGTEHEWGRVTVWAPPTKLGYTWYLGRTPADATEVSITFVDRAGSSSVEIEHRGWERLGDDASQWRDRNRIGWDTLLPVFVDVAAHTEGGR